MQQVDAESGLPLWQVEMVDADPEAKKATRTMTEDEILALCGPIATSRSQATRH